MLAREVASGPPGKRQVALTYDDGPKYTEATTEIVTTLQRAGARATFFVVGRFAMANPDVLRNMRAAQMEIGNHSLSHPRLTGLDPTSPASVQTIRHELLTTHQIVNETTGFSMRCFRAPWGRLDEFAWRTIHTDTDLVSLDYVTVRWSIDSRDWEGIDADSIVETVQSSNALDGAIVLMHDGAHDGAARERLRAAPTVEATRRLVPWLIDRGYSLVTVSELLSRDAVPLGGSVCTP